MKWTTDEFTGKHFGKYEVLCRLAVGGMAEIFLGFGRSGGFQGRAVVLKRILPEQAEDPVALQMLLDEARLTATLSHPNVAQVLDLERDAEDVVLVIEFIGGANAEEVVEVYRDRGEAVPLGFALAASREAAQGLAHAHGQRNARGEPVPIIHRDVTPRNVMVDFNGAIKVLDFGIARAKGSERRTQAGMVRGTTAYMSPEQAIGKEDLDHRTDLFSLGVIAHELLTGQRLFYKGNPAQEMAAVYEGEIPLPSRVNRRVPKAIDPVVMRALERKPERRYQSALEFIRDLSLAAGSTMWSRERCAEMSRAQFSERQADIERLLARIPLGGPDYPEGRTLIARGGPALAEQPPARPPRPATPREGSPRREGKGAETRGAETRADFSWLASATDPGRPSPLADPLRAVQTEVGREPVTDTSRAREARLTADELFGDLGEAEQTHLVPGSKRNPPPAEMQRAGDSLEPDPRPGGGGHPTRLMLAAVAALILGGAGGAAIFSLVRRPTPPAMVRVTISSDRPADVSLAGQGLGRTPVTVFFPVGHLELQFKEEGKPVRVHDAELAPQVDNVIQVQLDSLPAAPSGVR